MEARALRPRPQGPPREELGPRPEEPPREGLAEPIGFERFPLFDSARAIAVLLVVTIHAAGQAGGSTTGVLSLVSHFDVGVTIFFLISGFLLYRPFVVAHAQRARQPSAGAYAWRRLLRIVPAYWLALTVAAVVLDLPGVLTREHGPNFYGFAQIYDWDTRAGGIPQAWSLDVEMAFYLFLPLYGLLIQRLIGARRDWVRIELIGLGALVVVATVYKAVLVLPTTYGDPYPLATGFLPTYLDHFAIGMGLAVVSVQSAQRGSLPRPLKTVERFPSVAWALAIGAFLLIVAIGIPAVYVERPTSAQFFERHWLYGVVALGVLLPVAFGDAKRGWVRRLLGNRALLYVGTISYGVYLWHRPLMREGRELGIDFGGGWKAYVAWTLFGVAISTAVAALSWHAVERPILRLKRLVPDRSRRAQAAVPAPAPGVSGGS